MHKIVDQQKAQNIGLAYNIILPHRPNEFFDFELDYPFLFRYIFHLEAIPHPETDISSYKSKPKSKMIIGGSHVVFSH